MASFFLPVEQLFIIQSIDLLLYKGIYPHIVDFHALWPDIRVDALRSTPVTADRNVHDEIETLVKRPPFVVITRFAPDCMVELVIDIKRHPVFLPINRINMEFVLSARDRDFPFLLRSEEHTSELQSPCNL